VLTSAVRANGLRRGHECDLARMERARALDGVICGRFHLPGLPGLHKRHGAVYANCGEWLVCGLDEFNEETLQSSFLLDWPDLDVTFYAASEGDRAVPLVRLLIAEYPRVRARLLIGEDRISGNSKLNNLGKGWAAATTDYVCMTDSNLLLPPNYPRALPLHGGRIPALARAPPSGRGPAIWSARWNARS